MVATYHYDELNRLTGIEWQSGGKAAAKVRRKPCRTNIEYGYDAAGRVQSLTLHASRNSTALLSGIGYNDFTGMKGWTFGNGSGYGREYEWDGRVSRYPLGEASAGGLVRTLTYDAASRVRSLRHNGQPDAARFDQGFEYDKRHRLTQYTASDQSQTFGYDDSGNRTRLQQGSASYPILCQQFLHPQNGEWVIEAGPYRTRRYFKTR